MVSYKRSRGAKLVCSPPHLEGDGMSNPTIGFIGLGAMGEPMVANLLNAGFRVMGYVNRSRDGMDRLAPQGLIEVANARELGEQSDL